MVVLHRQRRRAAKTARRAKLKFRKKWGGVSFLLTLFYPLRRVFDNVILLKHSVRVS